MASSYNTSDILEESSKITDTIDGRPHFTPEQHEKAQKSENPLIKKLQKEAIEKTFVESFGIETTEKKKRGRPPSVNPPAKKPSSLKNSREDIPTFSSSPHPPSESSEEFETKRKRKQILEYCRDYPFIPQQVGFNPANLCYLSLEQLTELFTIIKQELNPVIEYTIISNVFYGVMSKIEYLCAYLNSVAPNPFLESLACQSPGTFEKYLRMCDAEGDGCRSELKAIAIEWMGLIPQNPYFQLLVKVIGKGYDFVQFKQESSISRMKENMTQMPKPNISAEMKQKVKKVISKK